MWTFSPDRIIAHSNPELSIDHCITLVMYTPCYFPHLLTEKLLRGVRHSSENAKNLNKTSVESVGTAGVLNRFPRHPLLLELTCVCLLWNVYWICFLCWSAINLDSRSESTISRALYCSRTRTEINNLKIIYVTSIVLNVKLFFFFKSHSLINFRISTSMQPVTWCRWLLKIFQTITYGWSINTSLKHQRLTPWRCKDMGIKKYV